MVFACDWVQILEESLGSDVPRGQGLQFQSSLQVLKGMDSGDSCSIPFIEWLQTAVSDRTQPRLASACKNDWGLLCCGARGMHT